MGAEPLEHPAYRVVNAQAATRLLLVCEHASNTVLPEYANLGLPQHELDRHIGHDIGAAALTTRLAALLDAPAVLCRHSRLFVDCNRAPSDASWICEQSDGTAIPGNQNLDATERALRAARVFNPFHCQIEQMLDQRRLARQAVQLIAIHSFTPVLAGQQRPWQVGIVWRHESLASSLAQPLLRALRRDPALCVGDNQPYDGRVFCGHTLDRHAEPYGTPGVVIEVRQDEIAEPAGVERWAQVLAQAIGPLVSAIT